MPTGNWNEIAVPELRDANEVSRLDIARVLLVAAEAVDRPGEEGKLILHLESIFNRRTEIG